MRLWVWLLAGLGCALSIAPLSASAQTTGASDPNPFLVPTLVVTASKMGPTYKGADRTSPALAEPAQRFDDPAFDYGSSTVRFRDQMHEALVNGGTFALPAYTGTALEGLSGMSKASIEADGPVLWKTEEIMLASRRLQTKGSIDSLRMTIGAVAHLPGGVIMDPAMQSAQMDSKVFDFSYTRGWPSALTLKAGAYDLDLSPHAGLGMSNAGGSAEAGAMVRFGSQLDGGGIQRLASGLGLRTVEGASYGDKGRWYLFAAASGRAVGLNVLRDSQTGDTRRSGWSMDPSAALVGDSQAGLGWRKGSMHASVGYLHREVKNEFGVRGAGMGGDSRVALSLTIRPSR